MKLWITDSDTPTHRLVRINCENQLGYRYLGDLDEQEIQTLISSIKKDDLEQNIKRLNYYGYLHLFVIKR